MTSRSNDVEMEFYFTCHACASRFKPSLAEVRFALQYPVSLVCIKCDIRSLQSCRVTSVADRSESRR